MTARRADLGGQRIRAALAWAPLAVTAILLWIGWTIKRPCLDPATWPGGGVWRARCYSDLHFIYEARHVHDQWPYAQAMNEYPPVTAFWQALLGRVSPDVQTFIVLNTLALGLLALAVTVMLMRMDPRRVWLWAAAPAVALYYGFNWDLLAVAPATAGLILWNRGRVGWGGALIALGACAKWYPAVLLPILGMALIRRERGLGPQGWRFGLASVGVLAAVNLPVALWAPGGYAQTYRFHAERSATSESHWNVVGHFAERWDAPGWEFIRSAAEHGSLYIGILCIVLTVLVWRGRLEPVRACAAAVTGWLLVSPVLSMQYVLWVLPVVVLAKGSARWTAALLAADVLVFLAFWHYLAGAGDDHVRAFEPLAVASMLRFAALLGLFITLLRQGREAASGNGIQRAPDGHVPHAPSGQPPAS